MADENRERIIAGLEDLGLSRNEAKVYYVLVSLGESKASDIAKKSGVAREKTYKALKRLKLKGYVKEIKGKPSKWIAEPPEKVFSPLIQDFKRRVSEQEAVLKELEELHIKARSRFDKKEVSVWEVGEKDSEQLIYNLIKNTMEELDILLSPIHLTKFTYGEFKDLLKKVSKKDLKINIVTWLLDMDIFTHAKLNPYADVYILKENPLDFTYVISDGEVGVIIDQNLRCLYFTNKRIGNSVRSLIKLLIMRGTPLSKYLDLYDAIGEIVDGAPITVTSISHTLNNLLERLTSNIQRSKLGSNADILGLITETTIDTLSEIFPKYSEMSLIEKIRLLKTLFEALNGESIVDIEGDTKKEKIYVTIEFRYDMDGFKRYQEILGGKPLYPHPYILTLDHELRSSGYKRYVSLLTIDKTNEVMKIRYLYRRGKGLKLGS